MHVIIHSNLKSQSSVSLDRISMKILRWLQTGRTADITGLIYKETSLYSKYCIINGKFNFILGDPFLSFMF
jgi:hypothetical protein